MVTVWRVGKSSDNRDGAKIMRYMYSTKMILKSECTTLYFHKMSHRKLSQNLGQNTVER